MRQELPEIHKSCRKFIDDGVFGKGEEEVVHPNEEEQRKFTETFDADFAAAKAKKRAREVKGKNKARDSDSNNDSVSRSGEGES